MDTSKGQAHIATAITALTSVLGVHELVDENEILNLIRSGKMKEAIRLIALSLGLPIEVHISYVSKNYSRNAAPAFNSSQLVQTDGNNHGTAGILAQVLIPQSLPLYGTPQMANFPVQVKVSEHCAESPYTLMLVIAHELSHIVLHSMWHKERASEIYTDLTAMTLGFSSIMKKGRKIELVTSTNTITTRYGYLSDDEFDCAFRMLESALTKHHSAKQKLHVKIGLSRQQLSEGRKLRARFVEYLSYLDRHLNRKINHEDLLKISSYHQPGYLDEFDMIFVRTDQTGESFSKYLATLRTYTENTLHAVAQFDSRLEKDLRDFATRHSLLREDVCVLKQYVGLTKRLNLKRFTTIP